MSFTILATLALAAGLATAKPINNPQSLPALTKREPQFGDLSDLGISSIINGNRGNRGDRNNDDKDFNFIDGFNNFNQQQQVLQIQQNNLQIIDDGRRQQVVQQVQQVLIVDQVNNGFNNDMNNLFRKANFENQFRDISTVVIVVQEIQIIIDDGRGNRVDQQIFAQSAVVANRGARQTQTVMIFDERKLIAQDILGGDAFAKIGREGGIAGATGALDLNAALPTKTAGIQLLGAKPTWSAVAQDPAATLGAIWQGAVQDLQKGENDEADAKLNEQIAELELQALLQQGQEQGGDEQKAAEEQKKVEEEQKKAEEQQAQDAQQQAAEQKKAEEQQQAEEQKAQDEQKKAEQQAQDAAKAE